MHPSITEFLYHIKDETEFCIQKTEGLNFELFQNDAVLSRACVIILVLIWKLCGIQLKKICPIYQSGLIQ
jgi:hypothetical protein